MKTGPLQFKALEIAEAWQENGIGAASGLLSVPRSGPAGAYLAAMVLAHMIRFEIRGINAGADYRGRAAELCVDLAQAIGSANPFNESEDC